MIGLLALAAEGGAPIPANAARMPWTGHDSQVLIAAGVGIAIVGLIVVRAMFLDNALNQFYQANLIARIDYADILYVAPWLLLLGVSMAGLTSYATLRLYVRR